ncbi:MAG: MerR family transcriptional regulator [Acidobacteria bacterium]|nr:MerR family transcriptional regulator [Acidobacteriota bacterium]
MNRVAKKLYYKIGEVCDICDIQPHVLRYWETEFSYLSPAKNSSGQRVYRYRELQLVQRIKQLLYEEGYTIAGANRKLAMEKLDLDGDPPAATTAGNVGPPPASSAGEVSGETLPLFNVPGTLPAPDETLPAETRRLLEEIRSELESLLKILQ